MRRFIFYFIHFQNLKKKGLLKRREGLTYCYLRISHLSNDNYPQARIVIATSSLLLMYTSFGITNSSLPETSYIKILDIWFLLSLLELFIIILFNIFMNFFCRTNRNVSKRIPKRSLNYSKEVEQMNMIAAERWTKVMRYTIISFHSMSQMVYTLACWYSSSRIGCWDAQ